MTDLAMLTGLVPVLALAAGLVPLQSAPEPIPPPVEQTRADCASPTYASDMLVCSNAELLALDNQMASLLSVSGKSATEPPIPLIESQSDWFRRRSMCAMRREQVACLRAAYGERIVVLSAILNGPRGDRRQCTVRGFLNGTEVTLSQDGSAEIWRDGKLVAVALWRSEPENWSPYVTIEATRRKLSVRLPDGTRARC